MPSFTYKALRKEDNATYENTVEAKDRFEVYNIVRKEGGQVVSVSETKRFNLMTIDVGRILSRINEEDKIVFMRNLGAMLVAGLSLSRALNVMERQARKPRLKEVLASVQQTIQQGGDLNSALAKHPRVFSPLVVAMTKAGEESGSLAESLRLVSEQMERTHELKKKIRGAMIYPSVILSVLLGVGALMMVYIVPTLAKTFEDLGTELPAQTRLILNISSLLVNYTIPTILGIAVCIALFISFVKTARGKYIVESTLLHVPVIGTLIKETNSARTGRTLASLLSSGVHVIQGLEIVEEVIQNLHYKKIIATVRATVQKGTPMAEIFIKSDSLYPPLVGELIAVGEETGNLPSMLQEIANFYEKEVDQKTKNMSTIIEPILMLVVGGAVGYFAVAMLSPIYSVVQNIQ